MSATRSIPARTCIDGATFEMFLERVGNHPRCNIYYDPSPLRAAAARLSRLHRPLSRAHQGVPRQGRRVQSDRPRRASMAATSPGWIAPAGSARSATARSISAASSRSSTQYGLRRLGGAGMGMLHSRAPSRARARARPSSSRHIIRGDDTAFDDFAAAGMDMAANRRMLGLGELS